MSDTALLVDSYTPENLLWGDNEAEVIAGFCSYLVAELDRSPRTAEGYRASLRMGATEVGKAVHRVSSEEVRSVLRSDRFARSTRLHIVVAYRQLHKWGRLTRARWADPRMEEIRTRRVSRDPKPPVSIYTARQILEACRRPLEYRIAFCGLYGGLRIAESAAVRADNWKSDRLVVIGKGRKRREVPVHPELQQVKHLILQDTPASVQVLHSSWRRLRNRIEARDLDSRPAPSHALRRTCGDHLYDVAEVPYEVVATLLGHKLPVTGLYAQVRFSKMNEAIRRIDYYRGEPVQLELFA